MTDEERNLLEVSNAFSNLNDEKKKMIVMAFREDKNMDAIKNISEEELLMLAKVDDNYEFYQHLRMHYFDAEQKELQLKLEKLEINNNIEIEIGPIEESDDEELKEANEMV